MNYIDDYSEAFGPGEDSGNYIALHVDTSGVTNGTVEVINGTVGHPVPLDLSDGIAVLRIANKNTQKIEFVLNDASGKTGKRTLNLTGLTLEPNPGP